MSQTISTDNATAIPASNPQVLSGGTVQSGTTYVNQPPIQQSLNQVAQQQNAVNASNLPQLTSDFIGALASNGIQAQNLDNILNQYANYTYHIRWSMTNDINTSQLTDPTTYMPDSYPKEIIAESGVTAGFNIFDFEIDNLCAPQERINSMIHTNFTMTIKEPYGFSLLDRIYSYSKQYGVANYLTAPYFIEVWFTGYNEDGTIASLKQLAYKLIRVIITSIDADVTEAGTTYRVAGMADGSYGNSDHVAIAANSMTIQGVTTVEDFFTKLKTQLNEQQKNLSYDFTERVFYEFQGINTIRSATGGPLMKDWKFTRQPTADARANLSGITTSQTAGSNSQNITISRGMDIHTILYFVISMTNEGRQFIAGQMDGTAANNTTANIQSNGIGHIICIVPSVQLLGFDYLINDYIRRITYTFTSYETNRAMIDQNNVATTQQPANQISRAQVQLNSASGRYRKFYNFIYTGDNVDILKFDIKLQNYWQATLPSQLGENTYSNFTVGRLVGSGTFSSAILNQYQRARTDIIQAKEQLATLNENIASGTGNAGQNAAQLIVLQNRVNSDQETLTTLGNQGVSDKDFQHLFSNQSLGQQAVSGALTSQTASGAITNIAAGASSIGTNIASSFLSGSTQFLEDQVIINPFLQPTLPVSFRQDSTPTAQATTVGGVEQKAVANTGQGPSSLYRSGGLISAVLNDITTAQFFVKIELEIRGDPYWMGLGNVAENQLLANIESVNSAIGAIGTTGITNPNSQPAVSPGAVSSIENVNNPSSWFYDGETGFLLSFRTGEAPSETTGLMQFSSSSILFFGLYSVTNVKNKFSNGSFTQTLTGYKDALLNGSTLTNSISGSLTNDAGVIASAAYTAAANQLGGAAGL